ncbi:uracil-DNA glycosylase [Sandaracinobacteroides sp. A072]|uniref:uracil-DNA glycosylase n=1 Tax=Sandaracinobacteroides sp. A072 TaxID=3461146 RepID=UPI004041ADEC
MHKGQHAANRPGLPEGAVSALLDWWALSGAGLPVADAPRPWLAASAETAPAQDPQPVKPIVKPATRENVPAPREAARAAPAGGARRRIPAEALAGATSLDALKALVEAHAPGAPFADGNPSSGLMLLGEAPSPEDLRTGRPFTGPAGHFLDRMLASVGLDRSRCYIGLVCPLNPLPGTPQPDSIAEQLPLLKAHVRLAAPRLLLLMGKVPAHALTGERRPIGQLRGQWLEADCSAGPDSTPVPALATWNPAYLLRAPEAKASAWADLLTLKRRLLQ